MGLFRVAPRLLFIRQWSVTVSPFTNIVTHALTCDDSWLKSVTRSRNAHTVLLSGMPLAIVKSKKRMKLIRSLI
jgi:hypothetical protein